MRLSEALLAVPTNVDPRPDEARRAALLAIQVEWAKDLDENVADIPEWWAIQGPIAAYVGKPWTANIGKALYEAATQVARDANQADTASAEAKVVEQVEWLRIQDRARRLFTLEQNPPAPLPEILTLKERLQRPQPEEEWRIEGWQPAGTRIMLAAQYKAGKTTLIGNTARSLVDGDVWLGVADVNPVNHVIIIDFEMSERQIDGWLRDQDIQNTDKITVIPLRGRAATFNILDEATRGEWVERIRHADYLIVDPLRPILDALGLDEHREGGRFLTALDALSDAAGIQEALVSHHMGHNNERARGDSRFRDWPDVELRLVREEDEPNSPRYISAFGRDVDQEEALLEHDSNTRHLTLAGGTRANAAGRAALRTIVAYLAEQDAGEFPSQRAIEEAVGLDTDHTRKAIRTAIRIGVEQGQIRTVPGPRNSTLHMLSDWGAK